MSLKPLKIFRASMLVILFSVILLTELECQYYPVRTYSVSDGLPQSTINSIRQDCRGYIWISTRNGLARFDGMEAITYFKRDGLASSHVLLTFDDLDKKVWALTTGGLSYFDGNKFIPFIFPEIINWVLPDIGLSADSSFYFLAICKGKNKSELFVFRNGVYSRLSENDPYYDTLNLIALEFDYKTSTLLAHDVEGSIWKIDRAGIVRATDMKVLHLYSNRDEAMFKKDGKNYRYNGGSPEQVSIPSPDRKGEPFMVEGSLDRELLLTFHSGSDTVELIIPSEYSGYIIDREGVLWYYAGSYLNRLISPLFYITDQSELPFSGLWAISEDRAGDLWFGSIHGRLLKYSGDEFIEVNEFGRKPEAGLAFYKGSRKMSNGEVWFSTDNGILVWDGSGFSWHSSIPEKTQICYIYEDTSTGRVLAGTNRGLYIIQYGKAFLRKEFLNTHLGVIEGVAGNDWGGYWLSGHLGLVRLDGEVATPVRFPGLPEENTFTLCNDKKGGLWITSDEGLWYRNSKTGEYTPALPDDKNMPANSILAIDDNRIIVGRATDICLIYLDSFYGGKPDYFRIFDKTDGFMASVCLDNGIIRTMDGKIWILTDNEIVRFNPDGIRINNKPPDLYITGIYYRDKSNKWLHADAGEIFYKNPAGVELTRKQNNIRITFTGISTSNPEKVRYIHRLSGYEEEWSSPSSSRSLNYDNLSPGKYVFEIMAINADGVQSAVPQRISVNIHPAIWQRPVFIVFISLLSLLFTAFLTWLFLRKKQKEKEESQKLRIALSRLQLRAVLGQFDPHFTFNVISSVGSLVMKNEKEAAYEYITRLSSLLRSAISGDRLIIRPLKEELEFVRGYCDLQKLRFRERFNYEINIAAGVDTGRLIPRMTIQSFVENAIKHGIENSRSGGSLWIDIKKQYESVEIIIRDNGIGRASAGQLKTSGTGTGLKTISLLFDYINGFNNPRCFYEISDISEQGKPSGTKVRIVIPDSCDFKILDLRESETGY